LIKYSLLVWSWCNWHHNESWVLGTSLNWCCQLLPCFDGELDLFCWWKNVIMSALSNIGTWNQASRNPKTQPSRKLRVLVHCLAQHVKVSTLSAAIASSDIVRSQLPTVAGLAGDQVLFPTLVVQRTKAPILCQLLEVGI